MSKRHSMMYSLDSEHRAVPCEDTLEWARAFEARSRRVAETALPNGVYVSTVFLALDHQFDDGPPLLFETMIFGGWHDQQYQERCSTWEEALEMHERGVIVARHLAWCPAPLQYLLAYAWRKAQSVVGCIRSRWRQ